MAAMMALEVTSVNAGYTTQDVLTDVSVRIQRGEWFALLGPNGSGKTTLIHCIGGMLRPRKGTVSIGGRSLKNEPREAKRHLGFASAPERMPKLLTGRQCLEIYAAAKELRSIDAEVLALAEELQFTPMLDAFVDAYSLGTRQKLAILLALLGEPTLVVLDEAFNGLDVRSSLVVKNHLQARVAAGRCGLLLATHATDIVATYATHAGLLEEGRLVSVTPSRVTETLRPG
jgi:ABC-2 type transport system ATP-binding protein